MQYPVIDKGGRHQQREAHQDTQDCARRKRNHALILTDVASGKYKCQKHQPSRKQTDMSERSRILVVDDETQITRVLKTTLSSQGYEVKTATDGESGFDAAMDWLPDLIVTDLSMPRMSGIELCRAVRERSHVPIIVLSVRGEEKN